MFVKKYRPTEWENIIGNGATVRRLSRIVENMETDPVPNALLFIGQTGCGKTTAARILADKINKGEITEQNLIEINAATDNGIDTIRELGVNALSKPMVGDYKVYIIDEAQSLTPQAKMAILKVIEDASGSTVFILCSMEPGKLPKELLARCQQFKFDFPTRDELKALVTRICKAEGMTMNKEVFDLVIRNSGGMTRQFVQHLDAIKQLGASSEADLSEVITTYFLKDASRYAAAKRFFDAKDTTGRLVVLGEVDDAFGFTNLVLEVAAQNLDNGDEATLRGIVNLVRGVIRAREQISTLIGVDPKLILVANLA